MMKVGGLEGRRSAKQVTRVSLRLRYMYWHTWPRGGDDVGHVFMIITILLYCICVQVKYI